MNLWKLTQIENNNFVLESRIMCWQKRPLALNNQQIMQKLKITLSLSQSNRWIYVLNTNLLLPQANTQQPCGSGLIKHVAFEVLLSIFVVLYIHGHHRRHMIFCECICNTVFLFKELRKYGNWGRSDDWTTLTLSCALVLAQIQ